MPTAPLPAEALPAALEPIARRHVPGAHRARIENWRVPLSGFSSETYLFDLVGVEGPDPVLGLVFRRVPVYPLLPRYDLRRQYLVMQRLASSPIPVPTMRWIDTSETAVATLGATYFVMDRIDDVIALTDMPAYHSSGAFAEGDHGERAELWNACVDTIADIHRTDPTAYGLEFLRPYRLDGADEDGLVQNLRAALDWAREGRPLHPTLARALDWLEAHPHKPVPRVLCWGDSRMTNLLYHRDHSVAAVLDWELAHLGDPAADVAWMLMSDWMVSPLEDHRPADGTPSRAETVARYTDRTGNPLTNLRFYDVAAPLLLAVGMLRLNVRFGIADSVLANGDAPANGDVLINGDLTEVCAQRIELILDGD
jgi:aminoglycoside phosphotransferase (APT) family kinase protein